MDVEIIKMHLEVCFYFVLWRMYYHNSKVNMMWYMLVFHMLLELKGHKLGLVYDEWDAPVCVKFMMRLHILTTVYELWIRHHNL